MHSSQDRSDNRADDDPNQHGNVDDETLAELADGENDEKHQQGEAESAERVPVGVRNHALEHPVHDLRNHVRPLRPVDADLHQGHADDQDDRPRDDGRKQADQGAHHRRRQNGEDSGADDGTVDGEQHRRRDEIRAAGFLGRRDESEHRRDGGKGDAHHHRHPDSNLGKTERLDQRGEPAGENVSGNEHRPLLGGQAERPSNDEGHGDGSGVHHQHVLEPEGRQFGGRQ